MKFLPQALLGMALSVFAAVSQAAVPIRILTVFTQGAIASMGTSTPANDAAIHMSNLNLAFANSGVTAITAQSAGVMVTNNLQYDVSLNSALFVVQGDQSVLATRDALQADVVMVVTGNTDPTDGLSQAIKATAGSAFAAVKENTLSIYSYEHEFGHLAGARHQKSGAAFSDGDATTPPNGHGRAVGYLTTPNTSIGCINDLMAYTPSSPQCSGYIGDTRVLQYSNPSVPFRFYPSGAQVVGISSGDADSNVANVLNVNGPDMAKFRLINLAGGTPPPSPTSVYRAIYNMILNILNINN